MARALSPAQKPAHPEPSVPASLSPFAFDDLVERIRAEFIEQPGLRLTEAQGCRLWQIDRLTLNRVLTKLTDVAFLSSSADGRYARRSVV